MAAKPAEPVFCSHCGAQLSDSTAKCCSSCGAAVPVQYTAQAPKSGWKSVPVLIRFAIWLLTIPILLSSILGVLLWLGIFTFSFRKAFTQGVEGAADRAKAKADISAFKTALGRYHMDNGSYPTTEQGLRALVTRPTSGPIPGEYETGGYVSQVPPDPWHHPYFYQSDGNSYVLKSFGADGAQGGEGVNADIDGSQQ